MRKLFSIKQSGFTLLELLVVVVILGILATVGMGQYRASQIKARDAQRKSDLSNVARALEMYYNDYESYPENNSSGQLVVDGNSLPWGTGFETDETIYMKDLPQDPGFSDGEDWRYCYVSNGGDDYKLYARLENENDMDYQDHFNPTPANCNSIDYTYVITSSNIAKPTVTP